MTVREDLGEIKVSNEVISHIVRRTAREVEGVISIASRSWFNDAFNRKDHDKGISIKTEGNTCEITIEVKLEYGLPIYDVANKLQKRVKDAVEQMTGLAITSVNLVISGLAESDEVESRDVQPREDEPVEQEEEVL